MLDVCIQIYCIIGFFLLVARWLYLEYQEGELKVKYLDLRIEVLELRKELRELYTKLELWQDE